MNKSSQVMVDMTLQQLLDDFNTEMLENLKSKLEAELLDRRITEQLELNKKL